LKGKFFIQHKQEYSRLRPPAADYAVPRKRACKVKNLTTKALKPYSRQDLQDQHDQKDLYYLLLKTTNPENPVDPV